MHPVTQGRLLALALTASACQLSAGISHPSPTVTTAATTTYAPVSTPAPGPTYGPAAPVTASAPPPTYAAQVAARATPSEKPRMGLISRDQKKTLVGLTLDQAKQRLHEFGHFGSLTVKVESSFQDNCKLGTVCGFAPRDNNYLDQDVTLFFNRAKLDITPPPQ